MGGGRTKVATGGSSVQQSKKRQRLARNEAGLNDPDLRPISPTTSICGEELTGATYEAVYPDEPSSYPGEDAPDPLKFYEDFLKKPHKKKGLPHYHNLLVS